MLFLKALDFIEEEHPHMRNYQIVNATYQLSGGTIYNITFNGKDNITQVNLAIFMSTMPNRTKIISFNVDCLDKSINSL